MSNWIAITEARIKSAKLSILLESVQATAAAKEEQDPLPLYIAEVVARIRTAVAQGNALDADTTKIPASLEGLAVRMITRRLKDYCELPLTQDERDQAAEDRSYLNRITDVPLRFESPDDPIESGVASAGGIEAIDVPARLTGRGRTSGL